MSRIRGPYVWFCEKDEAAAPHSTRCLLFKTRHIWGSGIDLVKYAMYQLSFYKVKAWMLELV